LLQEVKAECSLVVADINGKLFEAKLIKSDFK
jgi:hypothetical protein